MPSERYNGAGFSGGEAYSKPATQRIGHAGNVSGKASAEKSCTAGAREETRDETVRSFALWILAHYTGRPDDRVNVASHGGLKVGCGHDFVGS